MQRRFIKPIYIADAFPWQDKPFTGCGWPPGDDYNDDYMPERSAFPVYGNLIRWIYDTISASFYSIPDIDWPVQFSPDSSNHGFLRPSSRRPSPMAREIWRKVVRQVS